MKPTRLLLATAAILTIIAAPIGWYLLSPLFITRTVNENFPGVQAAALASPSAVSMASQTADVMAQKTTESMPSDQPNGTLARSPEATTAPADQLKAHAEVAAPTAIPMTEPKLLRSGQFHAVEHRGTGMAAIYELPDGKRVLRLENFDVLNGPDLYVWLAGTADANDNQAILDGGYFEVAPLKGNTGNQNYELPADLDLSKYHSVTIWCRQFSVNFATAPLQ